MAELREPRRIPNGAQGPKTDVGDSGECECPDKQDSCVGSLPQNNGQNQTICQVNDQRYRELTIAVFAPPSTSPLIHGGGGILGFHYRVNSGSGQLPERLSVQVVVRMNVPQPQPIVATDMPCGQSGTRAVMARIRYARVESKL